LNQQQLQTARAALWHQTAPLQTADEATTWLEDLGLCLFLPRHAQLPAPAPSFVEAVHGAASAAPPASVLERASQLATRLVDERKAVPLNLLGTFSEQPDFLITPEILPWVAATRGDRQWNAAPGGRTAPLVLRTWEVLDREGEATAVDLRELLGRELTEAAVLRALIELWTTVRAMPVARSGEPTRWTLLKNRFPAQLATAANTAQAMAISAMLSIYLRSAVAATAEEAEIFLSPLTARSRIREVIHGMTAARQFGSMSVGSQTLLFVEGSLPEHLPVEEPAPAEPAVSEPAKRAERGDRPPFRKELRKDFRKGLGGKRPERPFRKEFGERRGAAGRPDVPGQGASGPEPRPPFQKNRPERPFRKEFGERRGAAGRPDGPGQGASGPEPRPPFQKRRPDERGGAKPWQRRREFGRPEGARGQRSSAPRPGAGGERRFGPRAETPRSGESRPWNRGEKREGAKPWQRREDSKPGERGDERRPFGREQGERRPRFEGEKRSGQKPGQRPGPKFGQKFGQKPGGRFGQQSGEKFGAKSGGKPGSRAFGAKKFGPKKPGTKPLGGARGKFPPRREEGAAATGGRGAPRKPGFGKLRESSGRPLGRGKNFKVQTKKNFRKANPGERNSRKNRKQEENPE